MRTGDPAAVGPYRLTGRLGEGGQGVVYLGTAPDGTEAAVKVLSAEWAQDGEEDEAEETEEADAPVVFSHEFAGRWVGRGTFPNGTERGYDLVIEEGGETADLTTSDRACTWSFTLFRTNNKDGYDGWLDTGAGCGPHKGGGFWIDGGRLVVMLWGEEGNFESHFFWLDRP
ncbi:hypothetical protein [Streptomonospora salina]|uniref:Protein kinase domain-containing protein n=1 Tax=Streptomonospora salina TaxID=104205 RepID=A0A841EBK6_9ACTN|nr:hypothetical protein [Streptomonospora salina]MBB6000525.1 hypothetical protein [Streptomonospora salina]